MTADLLLRGRILTFRDLPQDETDVAAYRHIDDGGLLIRDGAIVACGAYEDIAPQAGSGAERVDHRPCLMMAGFIDAHTHFPQSRIVASWGATLLDWLKTYAFPEEMKFADKALGARAAGWFLDELIRCGTTCAAVYGTVHVASAEAFFEAAQLRGMRMIAGKTMMDRQAPEALCDRDGTAGYRETKALIEAWDGVDRLHYALTPRFAITSTPGQLEAVRALREEHPDCRLQTHLSETRDEVDLVARLFPEARDYLDVYESYGLTGPRSLFGHCLHLTAREKAALAASESIAVFCPTSNLFLGSGLFDAASLERAGVRWAIATDIGGGTSFSMLQTCDEGNKALRIGGMAVHPLKWFYRLTLGNARALSLSHCIGALEPGMDADIAVLDARATPAMAMRMECAESLTEELSVLQTLGDDRAVAACYVGGRSAKKTGDASTIGDKSIDGASLGDRAG